MDLEETVAVLLSKNEQFRQENVQLKAVLSVVQENRELRARMRSFNDTLEDIPGIRPTSLLQNTCEAEQFNKDLQQTKLKHQHRTSSPDVFKSFVLNSVPTDTSELQSCQVDIPLEVKDPERVLGEIAYQLDRRILCHIFQGHKRLYGFTLLNISDKIVEVSTHPLTGKVDEGYRLYLTQRYNELMEMLSQFGYKLALHPLLAEFIVNTYGILIQRPTDSIQAMDYNNPEFLKRHITASAPRQLKKELLLFLTCLCHMADKDKKPLFLW